MSDWPWIMVAGALAILGGLGGYLLAQMATDARKTAQRPPKDRIAELEAVVQTYRQEVADIAERAERWVRRIEKRDQRAAARGESEADPSTEISTGFPQAVGGESQALTKARLRQMILANRRR